MKYYFLLGILLLTHHISFSQVKRSTDLPGTETIPSFPLQISAGKTTNLIFPYNIISVDRGSKNVLVQKVKTAENMLQIKAASLNFSETNLSVVTADKKLHSFLVSYKEDPAILNYQFTKEAGDSGYVPTALLPHEKRVLTIAEIQDYAVSIFKFKSKHTRLKDKNGGIEVRLAGIYIKENVIFFSLNCQNKTPISYDIESLSLMIRDHRQGVRTATQEIPVSPISIYGSPFWINAQSMQRMVIAVQKFTIPDKKDFIIQLREANGGRHISFSIKNKVIIRAKLL